MQDSDPESLDAGVEHSQKGVHGNFVSREKLNKKINHREHRAHRGRENFSFFLCELCALCGLYSYKLLYIRMISQEIFDTLRS